MLARVIHVNFLIQFCHLVELPGISVSRTVTCAAKQNKK
jgi:hypothetical protein